MAIAPDREHGWHAWRWRAALLIAAACGCHGPSLEPVGADGWGPSGEHMSEPVEAEPRTPAPRPRAIPVAERRRWAQADALESLRAVAGRGPSEHLGGAFERTVVVNDLGAVYERLVPGIVIPSGALVVQRHHRAGDDAVHSWFVMLKRDEDWAFDVLDASLRVAATPPLTFCARCHADAPHAGLFGPPRSELPTP